MRILGIRVSPSTIRYAILDWDGESATFVNQNSENKIEFPSNVRSKGEKLHWMYQELDRIHSLHPGIEIVGIKEGEYRSSETSSKREKASLEGLIQYWAHQNILPAEAKIYGGIRDVKSGEALEFCETNFGRTETYWTKEMADALLAAWSLREV